MTGTATNPNWKKLFAQMLAGAVFGAAVSGAILYFWKDHGLDTADPAQVLAFTAGMIYALIGLMVGGLSFVPRAGAQLLNVEDVEDLRDQQPILRLSAVVCLLIGLFFLILAIVPVGGNGGLVSREVAVAVAAICLVPLVILTRMTNRMV
ncbi:MAG TPA: hypothetical protein VGR05_05070, partial [Sphingomicrobium sp.]|nr:hypothetical protein [Sphingomicrobium sp.]